jgi:hypothetical protein
VATRANTQRRAATGKTPAATRGARQGPSGLSTYTSHLRNIGHAITIGTTLPVSWFRGHPKSFGNLTPSVYRIPPTERGGYREFWATERFRLRAGSVGAMVPRWDDHLRWLLLMQHFGVRTRLLDWSESILTALYFAVESSPDCAGEVWCIRPDALNNKSGLFLSSQDRPQINYLAAEAYSNESDAAKRTKFARDLEISTTPHYPIAFLPPMEFPRMRAQTSRFTIHPRPEKGNTIEELLEAPKEIIRYEIPANCKPALSRDLAELGVTAETLFLSLDGLAKTIEAEVYAADRGEGYPPPPLFD